MGLIHVACFIKDEPIEVKDDLVTLHAEAWRDKDVKQTHNVKIALKTDLYLDCLSEISDIDEEVHLYFSTTDSWKDLKKVFKRPSFAFLLEDGFDLLVEEEKDMKILKEF